MAARNWHVGKTQSTMIGNEDGYGFCIQRENSSPSLTILYATREESETAEKAVRQVIGTAVAIADAAGKVGWPATISADDLNASNDE